MQDFTEKDENLLPLFPMLLPYGHTVGAPAFRPTEMGVIISKSFAAMNEQLEMQKSQIHQQLELLKKQYIELEERRIISNWVYSAELRFEPNVGQTYHIYQRENKSIFLSLISPQQWSKEGILYMASVRLLADMTWAVEHRNPDLDFEDLLCK